MRRKEYERRIKKLKELHSMQLTAISCATFWNTESTLKERLEEGSLYATIAYYDVCRAVDREMKWRSLANIKIKELPETLSDTLLI